MARDGTGDLPVEDVQAYPRPPLLEPVDAILSVWAGGREIARTSDGWRVCETHHAPTYYFPPGDIDRRILRPSAESSFCEWKGAAAYWHAEVDGTVHLNVAWSIPVPSKGYEPLRNHVAFYPGRVEACYVGDVRATPQPGEFYGGWVTPNLTGAIKGGPGTMGW